MPNTRSKRASKSVEVENQEKTKTEILAAKARTTRSSNNIRTTRHYLQNITNPKISDTGKAKQTLPNKKSNQKKTAAKMGSNNNEELSENSATAPVETISTDQTTPEMEARLKRRSVDDDAFLRELAVASPTKKFKEAEVKVSEAEVSEEQVLMNGVNGLVNMDMEVVESMDVDEVEVEVHTTESVATPPPVAVATTPPPTPTPPVPAKTPPPIIVDDGEKPSTSKAAMAALAAATAAATIAAAAAEARTVSPTNSPTRKNSPAPSTTPSSASRKIKSLRKQRTITANSTDAEELHSTDGHMPNDANTNGSMDIKIEPMPLPEKLLLVISNLYLNAAERLKLDFPPRCAEDLEHCHQYHYRAALPGAPDHTQANNLRCALQQQRYLSFVNLSCDMCHRGEFPGEGIFTKLIELVLSFNAKSYNNDSLGYFFNKSIELFSFIVRKFPPCWLTMRKFYINFLQSSLDVKKISKKDEQPFKADNVLEILFELLASTLEQCSAADLQNDADSFNVSPVATPAPSNASAKTPTKQDDNVMDTSADVPPKSADMSQNSEYMNIWEWEVQENRLQTFEALKFARIRLERLLISLQLLLQILESDFVMWILHHHKKAKEWIFCEDNRPFVVMVFGMSKYTRATELVKQLFELFSICVNKRARRSHLEILERYISLVMVASNIADLEHSALGVRYPNLGAETKTLIHDFFKTFKSHNTMLVSSYLNTIDILRIPFVRYEFIDCFLKLFHFASNEPLAPKKIATDLFKKRWLKYKPKAELSPDSDDDLSREQYIHLLLIALQAYSNFHGLRGFFQLLTNEQSFESFRFVTDSVHRYPTKGGGSLMLERMSKDIKQLEKQLRMTVRMSKPKANLPLVDICIDDELLLKYRTDLKYVMVLNEIIAWKPEAVGTTTIGGEEEKKTTDASTTMVAAEEAKNCTTAAPITITDMTSKSTAASSVDFTAWRKFLSDYAEVTK